jgi:hypothetical protein
MHAWASSRKTASVVMRCTTSADAVCTTTHFEAEDLFVWWMIECLGLLLWSRSRSREGSVHLGRFCSACGVPVALLLPGRRQHVGRVAARVSGGGVLQPDRSRCRHTLPAGVCMSFIFFALSCLLMLCLYHVTLANRMRAFCSLASCSIALPRELAPLPLCAILQLYLFNGGNECARDVPDRVGVSDVGLGGGCAVPARSILPRRGPRDGRVVSSGLVQPVAGHELLDRLLAVRIGCDCVAGSV